MVISSETLIESCGLAGRGSVRRADEGDAIEGVLPQVVVEPDSPEAVAAVLAWSSRERLTVVLRGAGTKLGWGTRPGPVDLVLSTRGLNRVLAHRHGDLTATVEAGMSLGDLNLELARHRQWLPIDRSFDEATVGGAIATNDSGPLRHRHGTPRDLLLGVNLATTDGRLVKAGGIVVKNVAGYDLGKLVSGSFGSLAAIVSATFKLAPLPVGSSTVVATFRDPEALARAVASIASSQIEPAAFDLHVVTGPDKAPPIYPGQAGLSRDVGRTGLGPDVGRTLSDPLYQLLVQFASVPAAIAAEIDRARSLLAAEHIDVVNGDLEIELWRDHTRSVWAGPGAVMKMSWLPAALPAVLSLVADIGHSNAAAVEIVGRAGVGAGVIRVGADTTGQVAAIERLRATRDRVGHVVLLRADPAVREHADVWGPPSDTVNLLRAVKRAFDPAGILNAGRGPV